VQVVATAVVSAAVQAVGGAQGAPCCAGGHCVGGCCTSGCCSACSAAIDPVTPGFALQNAAGGYAWFAQGRIAAIRPSPDFKPPRFHA